MESNTSLEHVRPNLQDLWIRTLNGTNSSVCLATCEAYVEFTASKTETCLAGCLSSIPCSMDSENIRNRTVYLPCQILNTTTSDNTTIIVYGNTRLRDGGNIRVNGTVTLQSGTPDGSGASTNTVVMRDASQFNVTQGNVGNALIMAPGNITISNTSRFIGGLMSNGTITILNNGNVEGSLQASNVLLRNNAQLTFTPIPPGTLPGGNTPGITQCTSGATGPGWSE